MTNAKEKKISEPLFHIEKRADFPRWKGWLIRIAAFIAGLIVSGIFGSITLSTNPFTFFSTMIDGVFGTSERFWIYLKDSAILLGVSIAIVPAFKMHFWNLGGNGQVLMGALASAAVAFYLRGAVPDSVQIIIMIVASMLVGAIWALIPAIFKAIFKTNESLFTLMMNYIAIGLVDYFILVWFPKTGSYIYSVSKTLPSMPTLGNPYILPILISCLLTGFMYIYLRNSKHGYEISVVGESENTANYIGMNVKTVIIRTLILSGLIAGFIGFIICGNAGFQINSDIVAGRGFTAIIVTWLANFNPLIMVFTSLLVVFFTRGAVNTRGFYSLTTNAISDITVGIIFFFIIGCEFFINYKLDFIPRKKGGNK